MNWREKRFHEQNGCCWLCGWRMSLDPREELAYATFDHVKPRVHGGTLEPENVMMAHKYCNNQRGHDIPYCFVPRISPEYFTGEMKEPVKPIMTRNSSRRALAPTGHMPWTSAWLRARGYVD